MNVLFLTNTPSPYRVDFFNELGKNCNLTVLFERNQADNRNSDWFSNQIKNFKAIYLKSLLVGVDSGLSFQVLKFLKMSKFDIIVIGGYSTPTGILSILYLTITKTPFIINTDGGFIKDNENSFKRSIKRLLISNANYWLATGKESIEYLKYYGAEADRIFKYPFTSISSNDILKRPVDKEEKAMIKRSLNIKEKKIVISVGRFIDSKGFDILLEAFKLINKEVGLYIIGGIPSQQLINQRNNLGLENVHFIDFKKKDELIQYYMGADVFVLPTREDVWGLVVNEAMSFGLPVVTTNKCIAGLELIEYEKNGYIVAVEEPNALGIKLNNILNNDKMNTFMSENNLKTIKGYTIEIMAEAHIDIFNEILSKEGE